MTVKQKALEIAPKGLMLESSCVVRQCYLFRATTIRRPLATVNMAMKDLSTPIIDKARFDQEFRLDIAMSSSPYFPPMERLDWDAALIEFQREIMMNVVDRNEELFRRLADS